MIGVTAEDCFDPRNPVSNVIAFIRRARKQFWPGHYGSSFYDGSFVVQCDDARDYTLSLRRIEAAAAAAARGRRGARSEPPCLCARRAAHAWPFSPPSSRLAYPSPLPPLPAETPAAISTEAPAPIAPALDPASGGRTFFTDNAHILDTIEPIKLGGEAFARRLDSIRTAREPLGLVLSGGSARAFAHIGVLKALEEKGIRPDFIVANSMGAIVGMMYAAGFTPDTIESLVSGISIGSLIDLVLPLSGGFINAGRFAAFVRSIVGDVDIADLPIPIMIIFEDLKSRRQVRVMKGNFADVMAASFALPAVFEPVRIDDYLLIDGGITNLVPASAAYDYSRKVIVSVTMYDKAMKFSNPLTVINRGYRHREDPQRRTGACRLEASHHPQRRRERFLHGIFPAARHCQPRVCIRPGRIA